MTAETYTARSSGERTSQPRIALIGCGLSGAAFLAHLLRDHPDFRGDVTVIEPAARLGAGLAYGSQDPVHRTNVPAARMSLFPDVPDHFDAWLRRRGEPEIDPHSTLDDGRIYAKRSVFGDYVDDTLRGLIAQAEGRGAEGRVAVRHVRSRALSARRGQGGAGWRVVLESGGLIDADILVLGVSHSAPDLPGFLRGLRGDPRLVADPWAPDALAGIAADAPVCIIGTGLTACDVIASLRARGHRGPMTALSRRGLLPRPRTVLPVEAAGDFATAPETTAAGLLHRIRAAIRDVRAHGRPWEDVIDALRAQARTVWGSLPVPEKRRLLRHARPFWDVHRFQCAPQIDAAVRDGLAQGWLTVLAATPLAVEQQAGEQQAGEQQAGALRIRYRRRGAAAEESVQVAAIINCTGPGHRSVVETHPVLNALAAAGALRADPCRLGIDVDWDSRVVAADGHSWADAFVTGPLARGTLGELMGLPQVTLQPREVAAHVAALPASPDWKADRDADFAAAGRVA